jgi:hypothetical protein
MHLTWQINEEWWGLYAVAYHDDYKVTIRHMDGLSFWRILCDETVVAKGNTYSPIPEVQMMLESKLSRIAVCRKIRGFFRRKEYASSAA